LNENIIKTSVTTESKKKKKKKKNCKVLKRQKILRLFREKLTDTPEASREM
jgi:site-specific recombinase XerD